MKSLFSTLLLFAGLLTSAQILKIDKSFLTSDSVKFKGVLDATFALNNQSSTAEEQNTYVGINTNLDLIYFAPKSATLLISGLDYFKIGDGPVIYNGTAHLRQIFQRKAIFSPEVYTQVQFDESRNMQLRWLMGGGYRWAIQQKKNTFFAGMGAFREHEKWQDEGVVVKDLWKLNMYLSSDISFSSSTSLNAIAYYQTGYDREVSSLRNRVSGQLELKNEVNDQLKVKLTSSIFWDQQPIIPLNTFVYEMHFGLEYTF